GRSSAKETEDGFGIISPNKKLILKEKTIMKKETRILAVLASIVGLLSSFGVLSQATANKKDANVATVGSKAPDFTLSDSKGLQRKLSSYAGKVVVLEWLNYGCPFVKKHYLSKNMQSLQKKYKTKGVVWLSIISSAPGKEGYHTAGEVNQM